MADRQQSGTSDLDGSKLTHEMFMDSYMAGTSDGVHRLAEESIVIEPESYDAGTGGTIDAKRGKKP